MFSYFRRRLRDYLANRLRVPSIESSLRRLADCGFSPTGVYDVGAYRGEFAELVLRIWPRTHVTCFEPQESRAHDLNALTRRYSDQMSFQSCLLGATNLRSVEFHLSETGSSVLANSVGEQAPVVNLPMTTVDEYRAKGSSKPCTFLKLDVQGYELDVLRGAERTLCSETEVILAEVNFLDIYKNVPLIDETVAWLAQRNFVAYDIGSLIRRPLDDALWQADIVFVQADGALRHNKSWTNR